MIYFLRFFYFPSFVVRSVFFGRYFMATLSYYVGITSPGDTVRVYHSQTHNQSAFLLVYLNMPVTVLQTIASILIRAFRIVYVV